MSTTVDTVTSHGVRHDEVLAEYGKGRRRVLIEAAAVLAVVVGAAAYVNLLDIPTLVRGVPAILAIMRESFPPDFSNALSWWKPLIDTLAMSIAGTAVAIFLSFPLAFFAARNTSPHPVIFYCARTLLNGLRSVPELIMGITFVAAVGFGALPGVLALGLHSVGMVGKFFAEAI